jgi:hypothetical protein
VTEKSELETTVGNGELAFLSVLAESLLDNVARLEETVGRVTDFIMRNRPDRSTIVHLQGFDRLKQEFEALAGALSQYAKAPSAACRTSDGQLQLQHQVIAGITVANLRDRLKNSMLIGLPETEAPPISPVQALEIGKDVVY